MMVHDIFDLQLTVIFVYTLKIPRTGYCRLFYAIVHILIKLDNTKKIASEEGGVSGMLMLDGMDILS